MDDKAQKINCTEAVPGTEVTLKCAPYYTAVQRSSVIKRTCFEDRKWKPVRSFNCEPGGGEIYGNSTSTNASLC